MTDKDLPLKQDSLEKVKDLGEALDSLKVEQSKSIKEQINDKRDDFFKLALQDLHSKRDELSREIKELSDKKRKLDRELKTTFTGQSDIIARRVKGFQDFLIVAMQDLSKSVEQMEINKPNVVFKPSPLDQKKIDDSTVNINQVIQPIADTFKPDETIIRECLTNFLNQPDFYAEPWKLRRSLEQKDIDILGDWFFGMGGRGAQPSLGNRSKNILLSAGLISILGELYGDRFQTLVLAGQPERLGEWRRGLQDALGLSREDFGPNSGIVLFERAEGVIERADRLEESNEVPLILVDSSEQDVDIQILQFPLWLAFAPGPDEFLIEEDYI